MTLPWCSVHALKNKVLLKTPSGFLVLQLKYSEYNINKNNAILFISCLLLCCQHSHNSQQNNHLDIICRSICCTQQPRQNCPFI